MSIDTWATAPAAPARATGGPRARNAEATDVITMPYCAVCGHWAWLAGDRDGWEHVRGGLAAAPFNPGHGVMLAWCVPPAGSVSPAQHRELLAALDDAIAYREHPAASGHATAYRMLRRQLGPAAPLDRDLT